MDVLNCEILFVNCDTATNHRDIYPNLMLMKAVMRMRLFVAAIRVGLCCFLLCLLTGAGTPITWNYTLDDALEMAKSNFQGQDVDYYLVEQDVLPEMWVLFVDAQPNLGWEHECYLFFVHKEARTYPYKPIKELYSIPPEESLIPLVVKERNKIQPLIKPGKSLNTPSRYVNEVADRVWAVIISGGIDKNANYPRYWNDCSSIYQVLTGFYGIHKSHISVIMSDGKNPAKDMIDPESEDSNNRKYISSPLDLDGDGESDIEYSATRANISNVLKELERKVRRDDHVFVYVADHGGRVNDSNDVSYVCLWGMDENGASHKLYDYEFAEWIQPLLDKQAIVNVVLGQCYSGGFVDDLKKYGCVVSASSTANNMSFATWNYSIFLNNWTRAIKDEWIGIVDDESRPKYDYGLHVTMDEAFDFAFKEENGDILDENHPVYCSTPEWLGTELAFDMLPPEIDLFIKDNENDMGKTPNITTEIFYDSPSIWVRNEDDNVEEHENPVFEVGHSKCVVYVRIHNRGRRKYEGGKYLHTHWAKASLNFSLRTWKGEECYNDIPTGGRFGCVEIPPIEAGGSVVVAVEWDMTQLLLGQFSGNNENHHYCLLATIKDVPAEAGFAEGGTYMDVQGLKTQAQKNLTIIYRNELANAKNVYVRNALDSPKKYTFELRPRTTSDEAIYSMADIEMELSQPVYNAWVKGGTKSVGVTHNASRPRTVQFTSPSSRIEAVSLTANQFEEVALKFNFKSAPIRYKRYTLDLIQRDEMGQIVGGEAFIVESPSRLISPIDVGIIPRAGNQFDLTVNTPGVRSVAWRDSRGTMISDEDTVTVSPTLAENVYTITAMTDDGELASEEVSLQARMGIESLSPSSAVGDRMTVTLRTEPVEGDKLLIADVNDADCLREIQLDAGVKLKVVDTSTLRAGLYAISYGSAGNVVDSKKFTKR